MADTTAQASAAPQSTDLLRVEATVALTAEDTFDRFADMASWWPAGSPLEGFESTLTRWDRPHQIAATWSPGSKVQVRFAEVDEDLTTVIVEHRDLSLHGDHDRHVIGGEAGWWDVLRAFVATVRRLPPTSGPGLPTSPDDRG